MNAISFARSSLFLPFSFPLYFLFSLAYLHTCVKDATHTLSSPSKQNRASSQTTHTHVHTSSKQTRSSSTTKTPRLSLSLFPYTQTDEITRTKRALSPSFHPSSSRYRFFSSKHPTLHRQAPQHKQHIRQPHAIKTQKRAQIPFAHTMAHPGTMMV